MSPGGGGAGGDRLTAHGCNHASADDRTGEAQITVGWDDPHSQCLVVDVGAAVTWQGNFTLHPLAGGISPSVDSSSVITQATPSGGAATVTFAAVADFPYFCEVHTTTMQGVIYVE